MRFTDGEIEIDSEVAASPGDAGSPGDPGSSESLSESGDTGESGYPGEPSVPEAPEVAEEYYPACEVTIVVPVTSETADVDSVVRAYAQSLERLKKSWEAILVFDGVQGPAWEIALAMQVRTNGQVRTIALHRPFGSAVCLSSAFVHTRGQLVLTVPDYVQVDPGCLADMLSALDDGADMATGVRDVRVDPWLHRIQSKLFNWVLRLLTRTPFHDLNCSVRLMKRGVIEQLSIYGNLYRYVPILAYRRGFRVDEVKLRHMREETESGSRFPLSYIRRILDILGVVFLTGFTHKPLRFFGALGGACLLVGTGFSLSAFIHKMAGNERALMETPLFLIGLVIAVLGLQVIGFGLVGEIVVFTQARNMREYRIEKIHRSK